MTFSVDDLVFVYPLNMAVGGSNDAGVEHLKLPDPEEATYFGRVRKTFHQLDFRTAFTTDHQLHEAIHIVSAKSMYILVTIIKSLSPRTFRCWPRD